MSDTDLPITGICIVSKANNVPTGYQCIRKAHDDTSRDANLMADSFLERKERFLCITRGYPSPGNKILVIEDIKLINERDPPPPQYTLLTQTFDSPEKATTRRTICVKLVEQQAGMQCICDIIFIYRSKRPLPYYKLIGEINNLQMCIKTGTVLALRAPPPIPATSNHQQLQRVDSIDYSHTLTKKSDEKEILDGIPFEINPKYLLTNRNGTNNSSGIDSIPILSSYELEQNFNYDFNLERSSL